MKTLFGELVVYFDTVEELEKNLKDIDLDTLADSINEKLGKVIVREIRQPKPGFENIYRFTFNGLVELLKVPDSDPTTIGLVLFAYDPYPASTQQIALSSGVREASVVLGQPRNARYFNRVAKGLYSLTKEGKTWVLEEIVPKLRAKEKPEEEIPSQKK